MLLPAVHDRAFVTRVFITTIKTPHSAYLVPLREAFCATFPVRAHRGILEDSQQPQCNRAQPLISPIYPGLKQVA
jgi:hypothetical protein